MDLHNDSTTIVLPRIYRLSDVFWRKKEEFIGEWFSFDVSLPFSHLVAVQQTG